MHSECIATGIDTAGVLAELAAHPGLWNQHGQRIKTADSPHRETDDIWVRFRAPDELTQPEHFNEPHLSVFYPAWDALPSLRPILSDLIALIRPVHLGGILITRIPAGCQVYEHHDRGGWHAEYHNFKVFLPLASNDLCVNTFEDETVVMRAGEAHRINNQVPHRVVNAGDTDRITLIPCFRTEL